MRGWLTEGTLGVHIVLWTLAAMVGFVLAGHLAMIPHNPMGWLLGGSFSLLPRT